MASALLDDPTQPAPQRITGAVGMAKVAYRRGQLAAARGYFERAIALADQTDSDLATIQRAWSSYAGTLLGDPERAGRDLVAWLRDGSIDLDELPAGFEQGLIIPMLAWSGADLADLDDLEQARVVELVAAVRAARAFMASTPAGLLAVLEAAREAAGCSTEHCSQLPRSIAAGLASEWDLAVDLLERISERGSEIPPMTGVDDLYGKLQLGPAYEAAGRTEEAVAAYQRIVDLWADADEEGQVIVRRYRERISALSGG